MAMMGPAVGRQDRPFYDFDLEKRIPDDHLLRRIDAVLDLSWLRADLAPFCSHTGCPSVDPELMCSLIVLRKRRPAWRSRRIAVSFWCGDPRPTDVLALRLGARHAGLDLLGNKTPSPPATMIPMISCPTAPPASPHFSELRAKAQMKAACR
jgi:hypothetical protein